MTERGALKAVFNIFLASDVLQPQFQKLIRFTNETLLANRREYVCITTLVYHNSVTIPVGHLRGCSDHT